MKLGDSRDPDTKEESGATNHSRITPPRRCGREAATVLTRSNLADRCSPAKTTESGGGGGGTVVTVNGCPHKNSSVIYLSAESSPAGRPAKTGGYISSLVKNTFFKVFNQIFIVKSKTIKYLFIRSIIKESELS